MSFLWNWWTFIVVCFVGGGVSANGVAVPGVEFVVVIALVAVVVVGLAVLDAVVLVGVVLFGNLVRFEGFVAVFAVCGAVFTL